MRGDFTYCTTAGSGNSMAKEFWGSAEDYARKVVLTADGGYLVVGALRILAMLLQLKNCLQDNILSDVETIEKDGRLYQEKNFNLRSQGIDYIEFHIIDRIDALVENTDVFDRMNFLKQYVKTVRCNLEDVDTRMFHELRKKFHKRFIRRNF